MEKITNIALIEDREDFTGHVKAFFETKNGFELIACFTSVEDAQNTNCLGSAGILLLDIGLPGISGVDAIPCLIEKYPNLKIIMLSVFEDDKNLFAALRNGASGYLLKSDCFVHLEQAIEQVKIGGMLFSPYMAQKVLRHFNLQLFNKTKLTKQEKNVLLLLKEGMSKKEIANKLTLSYHTIDTHIKNIYRKLQVCSNVQAVTKATKERLI